MCKVKMIEMVKMHNVNDNDMVSDYIKEQARKEKQDLNYKIYCLIKKRSSLIGLSSAANKVKQLTEEINTLRNIVRV